MTQAAILRTFRKAIPRDAIPTVLYIEATLGTCSCGEDHTLSLLATCLLLGTKLLPISK